MKFGPFNLVYPGSLTLDNVSVEISNSTYHIVGKNGTGKSTIMTQILKQAGNQSLEYAYINQNYRSNWLWWKSIRQNLEYPLNLYSTGPHLKIETNSEYPYHKDWLAPLLDQKNQVDFSTQNELDNIGVSGGQLQKLVFLRELILKPQLLLLDEAFSALDVEAVEEICSWLKEAQQRLGFKIISISHDPKILEYLQGDVLEVKKDAKNNVTIINNPTFTYDHA